MEGKFILPEVFDAQATFCCGQTFRWRQTGDGGWAAGVGRRACVLHGRELHWRGEAADDGFWRRYFDLDRDYAAIAARWAGDSSISAAFAAYPGLRVLNQPFWETLCAFIISANNNIGRISLIMRRLSETLGEELAIGGERVWAFPDAAAIRGAGVETLFAMGLGYRAPYLYETAGMYLDGFDPAGVCALPYPEALRALTAFKGVGEKVADCVLLFSCGFSCAFPVDVWVDGVMRSLYGLEGTRRAIKAQSMARFGNDAGIVQQVLFHGARMGLLKLQ